MGTPRVADTQSSIMKGPHPGEATNASVEDTPFKRFYRESRMASTVRMNNNHTEEFTSSRDRGL